MQEQKSGDLKLARAEFFVQFFPAATAEMNDDLSRLMLGGSRFVGLNPERFISVQPATHTNFGNY